MLGEVSRWELGIWAALYAVNPWGELRADRRAAIGHALLANVNRDSRKRPEPFRERDFMPYVPLTAEERQREVTEQLVAALRTLGKPDPADRQAWKARRREVGRRRR